MKSSKQGLSLSISSLADSKANRIAFSLAAIAISAFLFLFTLNSQLSAFAKFLLCTASLVGAGLVISKLNGFEGAAGLYLFRSKWGLQHIDSIAKKYGKAWQLFAEIGLIVAFGSLSYFLIGRKKLNWKSELPLYAAGVFLLVIFTVLIPFAMSILLGMVSGGAEFSSASAKVGGQLSKSGIYQIFSFFAMAFGGISLLATLSVLLYSFIVASAILLAIFGNSTHLAQTPPGGMPIIPGINLDLVSGVLALAIVLLVHEGLHGILARRHGLPLKSAGLVFFGFIPFGAFVDVDDKRLFKAEKAKQNSVLVAGVMANFATGLAFLILLLLLASAFPGPQFPEWAKSLARFLALAFSLNTAVAAVNLIPMPLFDGYHLMRNLVGSKQIATAISYIVGAAFLLTLFPWILR